MEFDGKYSFQQENRTWFLSNETRRPVLDAYVHVIVFSTRPHPRRVSLLLALCTMRQSLWRRCVDQSNPDSTHVLDDINTKNRYCFSRDCPRIPVCLPAVMNLHWLLNCRGCKDPDTLWRTWFVDNRFKKRRRGGFHPWTLCFLSSVTTWLAVQPLEKKKKEKRKPRFLNQLRDFKVTLL